MTNDKRFTWGFIIEVLDVMERHGYHRSDNQHTGQAIGLIHDATRTYEGKLNAAHGSYVVVPSSQSAAPQPSGVIVSAVDAKTLAAQLLQAVEASAARRHAPAHQPLDAEAGE
jgi:hypothetical protein